MTKLEELRAAWNAAHAAAYKTTHAARSDDAFDIHFAAAAAYRAEWKKKND